MYKDKSLDWICWLFSQGKRLFLTGLLTRHWATDMKVTLDDGNKPSNKNK